MAISGFVSQKTIAGLKNDLAKAKENNDTMAVRMIEKMIKDDEKAFNMQLYKLDVKLLNEDSLYHTDEGYLMAQRGCEEGYSRVYTPQMGDRIYKNSEIYVHKYGTTLDNIIE